MLLNQVKWSMPTKEHPIPKATASVYFIFDVEIYGGRDETVKVSWIHLIIKRGLSDSSIFIVVINIIIIIIIMTTSTWSLICVGVISGALYNRGTSLSSRSRWSPLSTEVDLINYLRKDSYATLCLFLINPNLHHSFSLVSHSLDLSSSHVTPRERR